MGSLVLRRNGPGLNWRATYAAQEAYEEVPTDGTTANQVGGLTWACPDSRCSEAPHPRPYKAEVPGSKPGAPTRPRPAATYRLTCCRLAYGPEERRAAMSEPIFLISHFRVREGKSHGMKQFFREGTKLLQEEKPPYARVRLVPQRGRHSADDRPRLRRHGLHGPPRERSGGEDDSRVRVRGTSRIRDLRHAQRPRSGDVSRGSDIGGSSELPNPTCWRVPSPQAG
jgi:hypothetical protein